MSKMDYKQEEEFQSIQLKYQQILDRAIQESNRKLKAEAKELSKQIHDLQQVTFPDELTPAEEQEEIQRTVQDILNDPQLLQQVKAKMEAKAYAQLQKKASVMLQQKLEQQRCFLLKRLQLERQQFEKDRENHWKAACDAKLEQLAEEYNALMHKQSLGEEVLQQRRSYRDNLRSQLADLNSLRLKLKNIQDEPKSKQIRK